MSQSIKHSLKSRNVVSYRRKTRATVPGRRSRCIDVAAQDIIAAQIAADTLQIGAGRATGATQAGNHLVLDGRAVAAEFRAEVVARLKIDWRLDVVGGSVARIHCIQAVLQRHLAAGVGSCNALIDVDIALRTERERSRGIPAHGVVDVDITAAGSGTAGALQLHAGRAQTGA